MNQIKPNNVKVSPAAKDAFTGGLRATEFPLRSKAAEAFLLAKAFGNDPYWIYAMVSLKEITKRQAYNILLNRKEGSQ